MSTYPLFHEKSLFEATAHTQRAVSYHGLTLQEIEHDLLIISDAGEELARVHHGMLHTAIAVFKDDDRVRKILSDSGVEGEIILEQDDQAYPEVLPCSVWFKSISAPWSFSEGTTGWQHQPLPHDASDAGASHWGHAIYSMQLAT